MRNVDTLTRMMTILGNTGLYRMTEHSFVAGELRAYAAGLGLVYDALEALQRERFLPTAGEKGLGLIESITGKEMEQAGLEERRTMLRYRLAITPNDFTRAKIEQALTAAGLLASVSEDPQGLYINVIRLLRPDISEGNIQSAAEPFLPLRNREERNRRHDKRHAHIQQHDLRFLHAAKL